MDGEHCKMVKMTLPDEIIFKEILVRLPVKFLFRLKLVCKTWRSAMSCLYFAKSHALHQQTVGSTIEEHYLLINVIHEKEPGPALFYKLNYVSGRLTRISNTRSRERFLFPGPVTIYGSCHGLVALYSWSNGNTYFWNPATRKRRRLPKFDDFAPTSVSSIYGFGYISSRDEYKLFQGCLNGTCYMYTVRSNMAKVVTLVVRVTLNPTDYYRGRYTLPITQQAGVLVGEKLYWKLIGSILAVDLNTDTYSLIPLPEIQWKVRHRCELINSSFLCAMGGCLSLFCVDNYRSSFGIWKLISPEQPNPWLMTHSTKYYNCDHISCSYLNCDNVVVNESSVFRPYSNIFEITNTGKFLILTTGGSILLYDSRQNLCASKWTLLSKTKFQVDKLQVLHYVESLVLP